MLFLSPSIARSLGVTDRTLRRWHLTGRVPPAWRQLLTLHVHGDLGVLDAGWRGWILRAGQLHSPEDWSFRPGEVRAIPLLKAAVREYRRETRRPVQYLLEV